MRSNFLSTIAHFQLSISYCQFCKTIVVVLVFLHIVFCASAQYNGFSLSTAGVRIYDASASVLSEINKVPEIENRLVQVGADISQSDFDNICSKFKWIKKLSIENSEEIIDLSSVKKLKELEYLQLKNCSGADSISLAPFAELLSLKTLLIVNTAIYDYETLSSLTNLETLSFEKSPIASLDFLTQMTQLKKLNLLGSNHTFKNYDALGKLQQLTYLNVAGNPQATTDNLDVFSDVATFTKVDVSGCKHLKSLTFLYSSAARLQEFFASGCDSIGNFDILMRAAKLKKVDISNTTAKNITFLRNKVNMKELHIHGTSVQSIEELVDCVNMEILDISSTQVKDVSMLSGMSKLKRLNISSTEVEDVSALSGCPSLVWFDCTAAHNLASVEGMEACEKLNKVYLGKTLIRDLKPLYAAKKITYIQVDEEVPQVHLEALQRRSPLIVIDKVKVNQENEAPISE